jgi:glutaredoxin
MEYIGPSGTEFTIYSKSGCLLCSKVKTLLHDNNLLFTVIDCDDYILEDKPGFLLFIKNITGHDIKGFPIVFGNGAYIGSYNETKTHVDKLTSFDNNLSF